MSSSSVSSAVTTYSILAFRNYTTAKVTLSGVKEGDQIEPGKTVSVGLLFDVYPAGTKGYVNDTAYDLTVDAGNPLLYSFSFTMPSENITLAVSTPASPTETEGCIYTLQIADTHSWVIGIESGKRYVNPTFSVGHDDGYRSLVSAIQTDSGSSVSVTYDAAKAAYTVNAVDASGTALTVPITIMVMSQEVGKKTISYVGTELLKEGAVLPKTATPGDPVTLSGEPKDGYLIDSIQFSSVSLLVQYSLPYTFTMPNEALTITFSIIETPVYGSISINPQDHITSTAVYLDEAMRKTAGGYLPGKDLYVKFTTETGYHVQSVSDTSGKNTFTKVSTDFFHTVVASDTTGTLEIAPVVDQSFTVTFATVPHVTFTLLKTGGNEVEAGSTVNYTAVPDTGYQVATWVKDIKAFITHVSDTQFSFVMPASDVVIEGFASAHEACRFQIQPGSSMVEYCSDCEILFTDTTTGMSGTITPADEDKAYVDCFVGDVFHFTLNMKSADGTPVFQDAETIGTVSDFTQVSSIQWTWTFTITSSGGWLVINIDPK